MTKRTGDGVDKTLRNLFHKKDTPKSAFVLLLLIYALSAVLTTMSSRIRGQVVLFDIPFEYSSLTGVFSLLSNTCAICLVMLFHKVGYITAMILVCSSFPMMFINVFIRQNYRNIPGFFNGLMVIVAITIIFLGNRKIVDYQNSLRKQAVTDSGMLYTANYDEMAAQHIRTGADITLMYSTNPGIKRSGVGHYIKLAEDGRVLELENNPVNPSFENTYMEAFLIRRELLIELADRAVSRAQYHFTRELLQQAIHENTLKVYGWKNDSPCWRLDTVQAYFECNADLLKPDIRQKILRSDRPVWTKMRDEMPTRYAPGAQVKNSLLADGCVIEGTVENSILFRGVHVQKDAVVKNAVIMQDGYVMSGSRVEGCILDKQVTVRDHVNLCAPVTYPVVIGKGTTV